MMRALRLCGLAAATAVYAVLSAECGYPEKTGSCPAEPVKGSALFQSRLHLEPLRETMSDGSARGSVLQSGEQAPKGQGTGHCDLCAHDWVIVLAMGRSGSTTVLQMLNALPGFFVAGEHAGVLTNLMSFWKNVFENPSWGSDPSNTTLTSLDDYKDHANTIGPWFHAALSKQEVLCALQHAATALLGDISSSDDTTLGFKEIRYHTKDMLDFLSRLFPCARFVVNVRKDVEAQAASGWWAGDGKQRKVLEEGTSVLKAWQAHDPSRRYLLELESFSTKVFNNMLEWLGVTGCTFTQVAHANVNGSYEGLSAEQPMVTGNCSKRQSQRDSQPRAPAADASVLASPSPGLAP